MNGVLRLPTLYLNQILMGVIVYGFLLCIRAIVSPDTFIESTGVLVLVSVVGGVGIVVLPSISPGLAAVMLMLAGRSELPPLWTGLFDVTALLVFGFLISGVYRIITIFFLSGKIKISLHPVSIFAFVFSVLYFMQYAFSTPTEYALEKVVRVAGFALILLLVFAQVLLSREMRDLFCRYYLLIIGAMSFVSLAIAVAQQGFLGIQRISPVGGGPITLGRFTGFAAVLCLLLFLGHGGRRYLVLFTWFAIVTFLNGSRGPLLSLVITVAVLATMALIVKSNWRRWLQLVAFLGVSALGLMLTLVAALGLQMPFARRYEILLEEDGGGASVSTRFDLVFEAMRLADDAPFWGSGVASWEYLSERGDIHSYPHNFIAETVVENGFLGAALFGCLIIMALVIGTFLLMRSASAGESSDAMIGLGLLIFSIIGALLSGDLYDNRYIWAAVGWLSAVWYWRRSSHSPACSLASRHNGSEA